MPELHVVAGPNGIGKTSIFEDLVPAGIDYINADSIAKTIREKAGGLNVQDLANQEASLLFFQKVKEQKSFSIETNLCDVETYKSFQGLQAIGYKVFVYFLAVDSVDVCINRVKLRVSQGGHNVNPDVIKERYAKGIALLKHYKNFPDSLILLDNGKGYYTPQALLNKGVIQMKVEPMQSWAKSIVEQKTSSSKLDDVNSVDEIRRLYKKGK